MFSHLRLVDFDINIMGLSHDVIFKRLMVELIFDNLERNSFDSELFVFNIIFELLHEFFYEFITTCETVGVNIAIFKTINSI